MKRKLIQLILVLFITNAYAQHPLDGINGRWAVIGDSSLPDIFMAQNDMSNYNLCAIDLRLYENNAVSGFITFYDDVEFHVNEMSELKSDKAKYLLKGDIKKCEPWYSSDNVFRKYSKTGKSAELSLAVEIVVHSSNVITLKKQYITEAGMYESSEISYVKCSDIPFPRVVIKSEKTNVVNKLDGDYKDVKNQLVYGETGTFIRRESWSVGFQGKEYYWYEVELNDGSRGYVWAKDIAILEPEKKGIIDKKCLKGGWRVIDKNETKINFDDGFSHETFVVYNGEGEKFYDPSSYPELVGTKDLQEIGLNEYNFIICPGQEPGDTHSIGSIKIISPFCIVYTSNFPSDEKRNHILIKIFDWDIKKFLEDEYRLY